MENFKRAEEFYLRGFGSEYIKRRTGISLQKLTKKLASEGVKYSKDDIAKYQIAYIRVRYTIDDIKKAYRYVSEKYANLEKASRGKHIECLGCGFGQLAVVFTALLGESEYKALRSECWQTKQRKTMQSKYGVNNAFEKDSGLLKDGNPMLSDSCKVKRRQTMVTRYGVPEPNQNLQIKQKMLNTLSETNLERYGVEYPMQNKEIATKAADSRQRTMLEKYGAPNSVQVDEIKNRIFEARKKNGTLNSSMGEDVLYDMLVVQFGVKDVLRNVCVDERYPYHVDFYIKSRDLFIEFNGDKCHNTHWFDASNEQDIQVVQSWEENRARIEATTSKQSRYDKYIRTWTQSDVKKRQTAAQNHLNYLVFWDSSRKCKNKKQYPRLQDACEWFQAGCPDSYDWYAENTY